MLIATDSSQEPINCLQLCWSSSLGVGCWSEWPLSQSRVCWSEWPLSQSWSCTVLLTSLKATCS